MQQPGQVFYWRERNAQAVWAACAEFAALRVPALGCSGCAMACGAREGMDCFVPRDGRVLGYDNSHGFSHRHYLGTVTAEAFPGYEALYERFESEWRDIAIRFVNGEM